MLDMEAYPQGLIKKVTHKERKEKQPLLYDLTEIQKDANKRFKFSAEKTLSLMQSLYEKHKVYLQPINYPTVPRGEERLRITPTPLHTDAMIDDLIYALKLTWKKLKLKHAA